MVKRKLICAVCGGEAYQDYHDRTFYVYCKNKKCRVEGKPKAHTSDNFINGEL